MHVGPKPTSDKKELHKKDEKHEEKKEEETKKLDVVSSK